MEERTERNEIILKEYKIIKVHKIWKNEIRGRGKRK